jgi:hypothetical protein
MGTWDEMRSLEATLVFLKRASISILGRLGGFVTSFFLGDGVRWPKQDICHLPDSCGQRAAEAE